MSINAAKRAAVRELYNYRCGYCNVSEVSVGNKLDIDHYRPVKHGGNDEMGNLIYVCPACNRFKGNYWPKEGCHCPFRLKAANGHLVPKGGNKGLP